MFKAAKSSTTLSITLEALIWQDFFMFFKWQPFRVTAWASPSHLEKIQANEELAVGSVLEPKSQTQRASPSVCKLLGTI